MTKLQNNQTVTNVRVSCTKENCGFYIDWDGVTPQHALDFYKNWNVKYYKVMKCIHTYQVTKGETVTNETL